MDRFICFCVADETEGLALLLSFPGLSECWLDMSSGVLHPASGPDERIAFRFCCEAVTEVTPKDKATDCVVHKVMTKTKRQRTNLLTIRGSNSVKEGWEPTP